MSSRVSLMLVLFWASACEPAEVLPDRTDTDDGSDVQCGEIQLGLSLRFVGVVKDEAGDPAEGAVVVLEDRNPRPVQDRGTAVSGADGRFEFVASDLTFYPGCFNDVVDYWLVATLGAASAERNINRLTYDAFAADGEVVNATSYPLLLAP